MNTNGIATKKDFNATKQDRLILWVCFALFVIMYVVVSLFHEPMYDEAQAWMIARDASWYELFFEIPHYEGHPPFWHIVIALFAKTGMSIDLGLRIPGAFFSIGTVWLLLFRSPFPKIVKCLLPFTYYIFFRYSIVVRPYCVMMFALCLVAMAYKKRAEKPFVFIASLMLLCASSAYGMALAAGICIVWIWELFAEIKRNYAKQIGAMAVLFVCNLMQLLLMLPKEDTNSVSVFSLPTILYSMIYMCVLGPADSMFMDVGMDARLQSYAKQIVDGGVTSWCNLLIGFVTVVILLYFASKYRKKKLLIIPYLLFSLFSSAVYFWYHHIGIIHLYLIFVFWCALADKDVVKTREIPVIFNKIAERNGKTIKNVMRLSLVLCIGMSLAWNAYCGITDVTKTTWYTKDLAEGIRMVGADKGNCALQWDIVGVGPFEKKEDYSDASKYKHTPSVTVFFDCLAYFDENIFYNHNGGNKDISYNMQRVPGSEGQEQIMKEIAGYGYPEYIIGSAFVLDALPIEEERPEYYPVYRFEVYKPDKFIIDYSDRFIYAREDIYSQRSDWPIKEQLSVN